jgi:diguanylate cyclase (GGDEF)-like protein
LSEAKVSEQKVELQELNEQLMVSEEELRAQNDDLQTYQIQLKHDAYHDYLTNLPNRLYLKEKLHNLIVASKDQSLNFALITIGLDNFKFINNTYGHRYGDLILINFSERLKSLSMTDFPSRLSGDEFTLLLPIEHADKDAYIYKMLSIIKKTLMNSFMIENDEIQLTSSIGYSIFPDDGTTFEDLLVQADMAMYQAKKNGKSTFRHYNPNMSTSIENDYLLISHLKNAYEQKELTLHFQPQVNVKTNSVVGFEALLRWYNSDLGHISPSKVIPLAEASGLIIPIGHCIIEQSLQFILEMLDVMDTEFTVSINISVIQLLELNFVQDLIDLVESYEVEPSLIRLEITESVLIESYDIILTKLNYLKSYGFTLSLDDFGTGYSSLSYLQTLPINELKIDKQFIDEILITDKSHFLLDTIIDLAHKLNLTIVAEGVEHLQQAEYLSERGCHIMQGFYFSKPAITKDVILYCQTLKKLI